MFDMGLLLLPEDFSPPGLLGGHDTEDEIASSEDTGHDAVNTSWQMAGHEEDTRPDLEAANTFLYRPTLFNWQKFSGSWQPQQPQRPPARYLVKQMVYDTELNRVDSHKSGQ